MSAGMNVSAVGGGACVTCLRHVSKEAKNKNKHNIDLAKRHVAPCSSMN